jgi:hypothetical protein
MIVFIDRQHAGQAKKIDSRGAIHDLNGDGKRTPEEMEAILTGYMAMDLEVELLGLGVKVVPISDGSYKERHARVNEYAKMFAGEKMIYLALHFNAGGGTYGAYFYDHRSEAGKDLAQCICKFADANLGELQSNKFIAASKEDWTKNAFYCIAGVATPVALCLEPAFIDTLAHQQLFTMGGLKRIAHAIACGIVEWGK